jgi:2,3-bisphosphoglycerate-dependent phosphoglycerate mutase
VNIWLIRHGTTGANLEGRLQGRLDIPLNPRGRHEAEQIASRLRSSGLQLILSSDLGRARETAQLIGRKTGLRPVMTPLLRECSWGSIEGMTLPEIEGRYGKITRDLHGGIKACYYGGERPDQLFARAGLVYRVIKRRCCNHSSLALVSHGRFLNAFLAKGLGLQVNQRWPFAPAPASLSLICYDPIRRSYRLELFNDRCHLQAGAFL